MMESFTNTIGDWWASRLLVSVIIFFVIISAIVYVTYKILNRLLPGLLWFEFQLTNKKRLSGQNPSLGTYLFDDFVLWMTNNFKRIMTIVWLLFLVMGLFVFREQIYNTMLMQQVLSRSEPYLTTVENRFNEMQRQIELSKKEPEENVIINEDDVTVEPSPTRKRPTATPKPTATTVKTPTIPAEKVEYEIYVVEKGDSLFNIALDHGVTIEEIVEVNKGKYPSLEEDQRLLGIGWELNIPQN